MFSNCPNDDSDELETEITIVNESDEHFGHPQRTEYRQTISASHETL